MWNDNVHDAPSNYAIALKVLERVTEKLSLNNQLEQYNKIFLDQLEEDIIEDFFILRKTSLSIYGYLIGLCSRPMNSLLLKCDLCLNVL